MDHIMKQSCSVTRTRMIRGVLLVKVTRVKIMQLEDFLTRQPYFCRSIQEKKETPMEMHHRCLCVCDKFAGTKIIHDQA